MASIPQARPRSKKTKRLGPVRVIRPEQYEAFDVNSKVACIQALIPLGLLRIQELLEEEVSTWPEPGMRGSFRICAAIGMGAIRGVSSWRGNAIRFGSLVSSMWKAGRLPDRAWPTFAARASWMRTCSRACSMGFPAGTMKRQQRRSRGRLACQARRCRGALPKRVRSSFRRSRTAT